MDIWKNLVRNQLLNFYFYLCYSYCSVEELTATVNQICSDYNIDLDDDSETPASQSRNDAFDLDDEIDLDDIIGNVQILIQLIFQILLFSLKMKIATKNPNYWVIIEGREDLKRILRNLMSKVKQHFIGLASNKISHWSAYCYNRWVVKF